MVYDFMEGWMAYAPNTDAYMLRRRIAGLLEERFPGEVSTKEINRYLKEEEIQRRRRQHPVRVKKLECVVGASV